MVKRLLAHARENQARGLRANRERRRTWENLSDQARAASYVESL